MNAKFQSEINDEQTQKSKSPVNLRSSAIRPIERKEDGPIMKSKFASSVANSAMRGMTSRMPLKTTTAPQSTMFNANLKSNYF